MTPEQLRESYRATHLRRVAIDAEVELLEDIDRALDAYALSQGYDLAAIVDPVIEQPASLPVEEGAAEDSGPVGAAPDPLTAEQLGHGPWFVADEVEYCSGCRQRRDSLEWRQSKASPELHAAIDAPGARDRVIPTSPPVQGADGAALAQAAGEVEDRKAEQDTGTRPASAVGPSSPPPTDQADPAGDCPDCGKFLGSAANIGRHRRFCKGRPEPLPVPALESVTDPRVIDEECRKCGQRFTWRPALVNHERACRGAETAIA